MSLTETENQCTPSVSSREPEPRVSSNHRATKPCALPGPTCLDTKSVLQTLLNHLSQISSLMGVSGAMSTILQMRTLRPKEVNELSQPCHEHKFHINAGIKLGGCPRKTLQQEVFSGASWPLSIFLPSEASKSDRKVMRPMGRGSGGEARIWQFSNPFCWLYPSN